MVINYIFSNQNHNVILMTNYETLYFFGMMIGIGMLISMIVVLFFKWTRK